MAPSNRTMVRWYKSFSFLGLLAVALIPLWDMVGVTAIMQTIGRRLVVEQSARLIEETGNNAITRIQRRSHQIEALARDLASLGETLPRDEKLFMTVIPTVLNFQGDPGVAGGGIWPEPFAFDPSRQRRSFFYGREPAGNLKYYDDYNRGRGYHHDEWYPVVKYSKPGKCFWSRSYTDPYSRQPMVTCSVAIRRAGQFVGVATVDLKLEGLHEFVEEIRTRSGGYLFLTDRNNRFITFPDEKLVRVTRIESGKQIFENKMVKDLALEERKFKPIADELEHMNQVILSRAQQLDPRIADLSARIDADSDQIDENDARMIAAIIADPLKNEQTHLFATKNVDQDFLAGGHSLVFMFSVPESYWKLIIVKPLAEAEAAAVTITRIILSLIFCTILAGGAIAGFTIWKFFHGPITQTLQAIRSVGELVSNKKYYDITEKPVKYAGQNELGELGQLVNSLATEVKTSYLSLLALNESLEGIVEERTRDVAHTLADVRALKMEQDGDYYLTSELIKPLAGNNVESNLVSVDFIVRQKKRFSFKKWNEEIGGDICIAHTIRLRGRSQTLFLNADAMGKSIQGAAGALVLGSIFEAAVERTRNSSETQDQSAERWLKNLFLELHKVFESFTGMMLVSLIIGLVDDETGTLYSVNADHPPMVLYRNEEAVFLPERPMLKVGMIRAEGNVLMEVRQLLAGDVLFVGSDGKDDIAVGTDMQRNPIFNSDENRFLRQVEESAGKLPRLFELMQASGEFHDDVSILKVHYIGHHRDTHITDHKDHLRAIIAFVRAGDLSHAAALSAQYVEKRPWDTNFLFMAARIMARVGYSEGAVDCSERLRIRRPGFLRNIRFLQNLHRELGNNRRVEQLELDLLV